MPRHPQVDALLQWQEKLGTIQKSDAWLDARKTLLTASDVPAVLGQNGFSNGATVMLQKLGLSKPFEGNEATRHGEKYEDEAIERYEKHRDVVVHRFGLLPHRDFPGFAGSPDGITDDGVLVEVKVRSRLYLR